MGEPSEDCEHALGDINARQGGKGRAKALSGMPRGPALKSNAETKRKSGARSETRRSAAGWGAVGCIRGE